MAYRSQTELTLAFILPFERKPSETHVKFDISENWLRHNFSFPV
jgi:hypothetical protein